MQAVIIGATGLVGSRLLTKLLTDSAIHKVISVGRKNLHVNNPKLVQVIIPSLDEISSHADELKGELYYCCLGTTIKKAGNKESFKKVDHDAILEFAKIALTHKAKSFSLISASGANKNSHFFYNKVKGQTEEDLKALGLSRVIIFRPSLLIGDRDEKRPGEEMAIKAYHFLSPLLPKAISSRAGTDVSVLANRMLVESKYSTDKCKTIPASDL